MSIGGLPCSLCQVINSLPCHQAFHTPNCKKKTASSHFNKMVKHQSLYNQSRCQGDIIGKLQLALECWQSRLSSPYRHKHQLSQGQRVHLLLHSPDPHSSVTWRGHASRSAKKTIKTMFHDPWEELRPLLERIPADKTSTIILLQQLWQPCVLYLLNSLYSLHLATCLWFALTSECATMCLQNRMSSSPSLKVYCCECLWRYWQVGGIHVSASKNAPLLNCLNFLH
jgi:hypothetical protein